MARKTRKAVFAATAEAATVAVKTYNVALYTRLSVEDMRKKNSDSIGTQKALLSEYLEGHQDMTLYKVYQDVNFTGTNYNRPGFEAMMHDIESGHVNCIIVKDLSRLGRSFIETGHFIERVFPFLNVRFIAINDRYDSLTATLDETSLVVPLKNLMNEVYARDISKKAQSSYKLKQKRGEFCGSFAPYGYIKVGTALEVDREVAPIVRQIFTWVLDSFSDIAIAGKLNAQNILPPSRYRYEKGITSKHADAQFWYKSAIKRITENPVYIGTLAQGKHSSAFLHGGGRIVRSPDEWLLCEDAHPAIVDRETFSAVQTLRKNRAAAKIARAV